MMGLSKVSHIFLTSRAIQQWRKQYWAVAMLQPQPTYDELPAGLCFGEHFGHLLMIQTVQFDDRTRNPQFSLGWQTGQLLATEDQGPYERPGLWYIRPPGDRTVLEPQPRHLRKFDEDLKRLPMRSEDGKSLAGLVLMTTGESRGSSPVGMRVRAFIYSLDRQTCREVPVQTDPIEHAW